MPRCLAGVDAMRIASDRSFPRHAHDQFGIGVMWAGGHASWSGCGAVEAGPGDVIAVSPEEIHDGAPIGGPRAWEMIYVDPAVVAALIGSGAAGQELGFAAKSAPPIAQGISRLFAALETGDVPASEAALALLLSDLLAPTPDRPASPASRASRRVLERIHDCPGDPPRLDEVAEIMGMGRTGALRRFRREIGATPQDYAMQLRLRLARRALAAGESPALVAADLGFADQSHLTRAFSRQFGLPPGRYRAAGGNIVQDRGRGRA